MEPLETTKSQSNPDKMELEAEKQTHRPTEQNREARNETRYIWVKTELTKEPKTHNGEKKASSINCGRKIGQPHTKA